MADEGFDACECIWYHELAMRRLLSILRRTQGLCTDHECFSMYQPPGLGDTAPSSNILMIFLIIAFVAVMYALRPKSLRRISNDANKTPDDTHDSDNGPPGPMNVN